MSESFESAMTLARVIMAECDMPLLDRLQEAHDRELEQHDVLGNERHEAVCELRKINTDAGGFVKALAKALGVEWQAPRVHQTITNVRNRLIYLLGGNEPTESFGSYLSRMSVEDMSRRAESCKSAETINLDDESDNELMENGENHKIATINDGTCPNCDGTCPNDVPTSSITDELREFATDPLLGYASQELHVERITAIADRIDERARLGAIKADVWQDYANQMRAERDELRANLDELRGHSRTCPESGDGVSESAPSVSITDELRKYVAEIWDGSMYVNRIPMELQAIADRIDAQFDRACEQQDAVLQSTIDDMADELDRLEAERDHLAFSLNKAMGNWARATDERDALCEDIDALLEALSTARGSSREGRGTGLVGRLKGMIGRHHAKG